MMKNGNAFLFKISIHYGAGVLLEVNWDLGKDK